MQTSRLFQALQRSVRLAPLRFSPAAASSRALSSAPPPAPPAPPLAPLHVSPSALARLAALRAKARAEGRADADSLVLRVRVDSGGCSGFKYEFLVESSGVQPEDQCFGGSGSGGGSGGGGGGACAVVDEVSLGFLRGATLDWEESLMRSAFTISANPNAEASCGCKMSFAAKPV
jgi:iron-sulfur cluster assembly accessory protein